MKCEHIDKISHSGYPHTSVYDVITMNGRMKDISTGEWYDAVIYADNGRMFVREKNDFIDKFRIVED